MINKITANIFIMFLFAWQRLTIQQAEKLLTDHEYEISSAHIMQLVKNSQCLANDCEFIALAQYLDVPLITADKEILREFPEITQTTESYLT